MGDHTGLTTDPRGIPGRDSTPGEPAGGLARLLIHLDAGPAVALARLRPDLVETVIDQEPPPEELLPGRDQLAAADVVPGRFPACGLPARMGT